VPDYTVVNLKEVENLAPKFGFAPDLESRFARTALGLRNSGLSYFRYAPGFRTPFGHRHGQQEEIYIVLSGSMTAKVDDELVELHRWDALRVPGEVARCLQAGPEGAEIIAFGAPNTENRDAEMLQGWWAD
jgi:uncharacterized cupin superfamily protein